MKLKTVDVNGQTYAALKDNQPLYIHDDGHEAPFDAAGAIAAISRLNSEQRTRRETNEQLQAKLQGYEGISDPAAALAALEMVGKLDAKKLIDIGEVDKVKADMQKVFDDKLARADAQYKPIVKKAQELEQQLKSERVGYAFASSKLVADQLAIPVDIARTFFGSHFDVVEGQVAAVDKEGRPFVSRNNPSVNATFDEGLQILIDAYPHRDTILKGTGATGGGARPGHGKGDKTLTRTEFEALDPSARMAHIKGAGQVVDAV